MTGIQSCLSTRASITSLACLTLFCQALTLALSARVCPLLL